MSAPNPVSGPVALLKRVIAFAGLPLLSLVAPFLFLPLLARLADNDAWLAIAIGQSIGGFAALVSSWGYATLAPPLVARSNHAARRRVFATSVHVRTPLWLVTAIAAVAIASAMSPATARAEAAGMALAMSLAALAPTWFWIGAGVVRPIVLFEVLPRIVATLVATVALVLGGGVIWYPGLLLLAMSVAPVVGTIRIAGKQFFKFDRADVVAVLRSHPPGVVAESAAGLYNSLAVSLVAASTTLPQAASYVAGDKTYRIGQYGVSALGNALQGWVVQAGDVALARRMRTMILLHTALGVSGLLAAGLLGKSLTTLLFGSGVAISHLTAWGFGVALLGISLGTAFGRIGLISLGKRKSFMGCVVAASVTGVAALIWGSSIAGAEGAAWALGATELASALLQGIVLAIAWRKRG